MASNEGVRIGNAERERVRELLQRHAGDGRLTLDELSDRLGEVYAARTAADLDAALRDLPSLSRPTTDRPQGGRWRAGRRIPIGPGLVAAVLLGLWAITAFTTGGGFFFPLWPLLFVALVVSRRWGWGACAQPRWTDQRERRDDEQPVPV